MGVAMFLVSTVKKEFFDFGKVFLDDEILEDLRNKSLPRDSDELALARAKMLAAWLVDTDGEFNNLQPGEINEISRKAAEWMRSRADWKFVTDCDEDYMDEFYLASDDEDAREYVEEFGDEAMPVYKKTGSI